MRSIINLPREYFYRQLLAVLHYAILFIGPLAVAYVTFAVLTGSGAAYEDVPRGIQLSGPIAAYVILHLIFRWSLAPLWKSYRTALDEMDKKLPEVILGKSIALQISERYAELVVRYFLMEVLLDRQRHADDPLSRGVVTGIISHGKRRVYGLSLVVGHGTILDKHGNVYRLCDVLGATIDSKTFSDRYTETLLAVMQQLDATTTKDRKLRVAGDLQEAERVLTKFVWRECEKAINNPELIPDIEAVGAGKGEAGKGASSEGTADQQAEQPGSS